MTFDEIKCGIEWDNEGGFDVLKGVMGAFMYKFL
jgi:hypothetical protein